VAKKDERLFAPFPIEMDEHPKIVPLSDAAFRALFEATFYSRRMLSDGFLDERIVLKRWGQAVADELSSNDPKRPSWIRVEGGWQIHDFEKHHPLRAEIEAKRADLSEKRSKAGKLGNESRWGGKVDAKTSQADRKPIANDRSETETETETRKNTRGTRVSHSFKVTDDMRAWAKTEVPNVDVDKKLAEWVDYWTGVAGDKGVKRDWVSTWRNGMRKQQEFALRDADKSSSKTNTDWALRR
jgi:hypothetical protein